MLLIINDHLATTFALSWVKMKEHIEKVSMVGTCNVYTEQGDSIRTAQQSQKGTQAGPSYLNRFESDGAVNLMATVLEPLPSCAWAISKSASSRVIAASFGLFADDGGDQLATFEEVGNKTLPFE
jgi:hypothetical protein